MNRSRILLLVAVLLVAAVPASLSLGVLARPLEDDRYTLLVMGSDMGPWRSGSVLRGRADAMHLVSVVPSKGRVGILSFPRDSYVAVPGLGRTRINASLTRGPETAVATVENLTGVQIDDWMVTGMQAFRDGISRYGGVDINVPQRLRVDNNTLSPGPQRLDGTGALVYGRDRKSRSDGDFGRNRAQAEILAALHHDFVRSEPTPMDVARVMIQLRQHTVTSIPATRMPILAKVALDIDPSNVVRRQVPGTNSSRGGAAVVVLTGGAEELFADMRDDGFLSK